MKYFILSICFLTSSAFANMGKVPPDWISHDLQSDQKLFLNSPQTEDLDLAYANILDTKMNLFKSIPDDSHKKWQLQSIKTEIAIEAAGNIGVMGAGGECGLELVWLKKDTGNKLLRPVLNEVTEPEAESVTITGEMNHAAISREVSSIVDLAMTTGNIKRRKRLFKNLFNKAIEFQQTVKDLENSPELGPWYAYKYQLELFVSAEGHVGVLAIGNSLRLRMEWYRLKKSTPQHLIVPNLPTEISENAQFISSIARDLESLDQTEFENGFRLNTMKIGVGTNIEGNLLLVKGKAQAIGALFFKRDYLEPVNLELPIANEITTYNFKEGNRTIKFPRYHFINGLKKSAHIARYFASRVKDREDNKFELDVIETEFELYETGGIGLVTIEGSAVISLFVTRNVSI